MNHHHHTNIVHVIKEVRLMTTKYGHVVWCGVVWGRQPGKQVGRYACWCMHSECAGEGGDVTVLTMVTDRWHSEYS